MFIMVLAGCTDTPQGITPVQSFDLTRYLGAWYEIYRLDHAYERDMQAVTATYGVNENGSIKVLNAVYDEVKGNTELPEAGLCLKVQKMRDI